MLLNYSFCLSSLTVQFIGGVFTHLLLVISVKLLILFPGVVKRSKGVTEKAAPDSKSYHLLLASHVYMHQLI